MKKIRNTFILILGFIIVLNNYSYCRERNQLFEMSVYKVLKSFKDNNAEALNKMIHDDYGLYIVHRKGVFDHYTNFEKIVFETQESGLNLFDYSYFEFEENIPVKYEELPTYSCDTEVWTKSGMFCDFDWKAQILTRTAKNLNVNMDAEISGRTICKLRRLEKKSRRVVLVDEKGQSFIFYLTKINKKWYLTILDRISDDCSA